MSSLPCCFTLRQSIFMMLPSYSSTYPGRPRRSSTNNDDAHRHNWDKGKSVPMFKAMIARYIPEFYSVKFPVNDSFIIHDWFFQRFWNKGLGRDFDMRSDGFAPLGREGKPAAFSIFTTSRS